MEISGTISLSWPFRCEIITFCIVSVNTISGDKYTSFLLLNHLPSYFIITGTTAKIEWTYCNFGACITYAGPMKTLDHFKSTETAEKSLSNKFISYKSSSMQSCYTFLFVFIPFIPYSFYKASSPSFKYEQDRSSSFSLQGVFIRNLFGQFLFWRWMWLLMLDFEEAVVPSVLYIWLVKREGVLHCTQNKKKKKSSYVEWPAACEHHDSTNHLWHFVTLNRYFSEISVLVLYMALILIVLNCRTILLLAFLWVRELVSLEN